MSMVQALGSVLTYLQRYSLRAAIGLAAAVDDDGRGRRRDIAEDHRRSGERAARTHRPDRPQRLDAAQARRRRRDRGHEHRSIQASRRGPRPRKGGTEGAAQCSSRALTSGGKRVADRSGRLTRPPSFAARRAAIRRDRETLMANKVLERITNTPVDIPQDLRHACKGPRASPMRDCSTRWCKRRRGPRGRPHHAPAHRRRARLARWLRPGPRRDRDCWADRDQMPDARQASRHAAQRDDHQRSHRADAVADGLHRACVVRLRFVQPRLSARTCRCGSSASIATTTLIAVLESEIRTFIKELETKVVRLSRRYAMAA